MIGLTVIVPVWRSFAYGIGEDEWIKGVFYEAIRFPARGFAIPAMSASRGAFRAIPPPGVAA